LTKAALRPIPGQEPKITERDVPVFDKAQEIPFPIVERPSAPAVSYLVKPKKRKPFVVSLTGEIVWRLRGGKGFTPYRKPWDASGLLRVRGRLMPVPKVVEMAGELGPTLVHSFEWVDYPRHWAGAEPGPGPYVLRAAAELAAAAADVSGGNLPGVREYHEWAKPLPRLADAEADSLGPKVDEGETADDLPSNSPAAPWLLYRLDMEDGAWKRDAGKRRAKTSEYRSEETGEYGPQTAVARDGRVIFKNGQPALKRRGVRVRGLDDYSRKARVRCADGKTRRVDTQGSNERRGRKAKFGRAMTNAERQKLFRVRKREKNEHSADG
jgi:hypothetical protein